MIVLSLQNVVKHYGPEPVLAGVTFDIRAGERVSLVGPNGAGKTTLMRIVAGGVEADSGRVNLHSSATLGYLEQHPEFEPGRTVWDEAAAALANIADLARHSEEIAQAISTETDDGERKRLGHRFEHIQHQLQHHDAYNLDYRIERVRRARLREGDVSAGSREALRRPAKSSALGETFARRARSDAAG